MSKNVVIIGAGGHGRVVADTITLCGDKVVGFLDDNAQSDENMKVIGKKADAHKYCDGETYLFVAIGNCKVRKEIMESLPDAKWYIAIHPSAVVSPSAKIGEGSCVLPNAAVNNSAEIGKGVVVNTGAAVDHDNVIGDYSLLACGAHLAGTVSVGECTWIGVGSTISNNIVVCNNVRLEAGTVVIENITEEGTYLGNPAKKVR